MFQSHYLICLLEILTDSIVEYNDPEMCLLEGVYRKGDSEIIPKFMLQPNPATDEVLVSLVNSEDQIVSIIIYDITGKEITNNQYDIGQRAHIINTSLLVSGIYLISVKSFNGFSATQKLIINH